MTNPQRDQDLDRLLGEYREELRAQEPRAAVLARLKQEFPAKPANVIPFRPSWRAGTLAIAASLAVAVGLYRFRAVPDAPAAVQMAKVNLPAPVAAESAPPVKESSPAVLAPARAPVPPKAHVPPLPSMQNAMGAAAPAVQREPEVAKREPEAKAFAKAAEPKPPEARHLDSKLGDAKVKAESAVDGVASASAAPALALAAVITEEVWEPGQLARTSTGRLERFADGREVRSALVPAADALPLTQNAAPVQPLSPGSAAGRRAAPLREMAEARARSAAPQIVALGEANIEGYRCTGTRTITGDRVVERWYAAALGLDLLTRVTEPGGVMRVTRVTQISRP